MGGFYIRKARGLGTYFTPEDFESRPAAEVTDFVGDGTGLRVYDHPIHGTVIQGRRISLQPGGTNNPACSPKIYLDGALLNIRTETGWESLEAARIINQFPLSQIAGIEVYAGPSSVPGEFAGLDTDCGVIAVWTVTSDHSPRDAPR